MAVKTLSVKLGINTKEFRSGLANASKSLAKATKNMSKSLGSFGKSMSLKITAPLTVMAGVAVKLFDVQVKAESKLREALKANGEQVQKTFNDYKLFASELQKISTVGDEVTLGLLQVAQSMGVTGEKAKLAVTQAISLSKALGVNERSAIKMTSALADGDAEMLKRYIPSLKSVKDKTELVAKANEALAKMFGAVTVEAETGLGPLIQLSNAFGDLLEDVGKIVLDGMKPFIAEGKLLVSGLQSMSNEAKLLAVITASLLASIGPIALVVGGFGLAVSAVIPLMATLTGWFVSVAVAVTPWIALFALVVIAVQSVGKVIGMLAQLISIAFSSAVDLAGSLLKALGQKFLELGKKVVFYSELLKTMSFDKAISAQIKFTQSAKKQLKSLVSVTDKATKKIKDTISKSVDDWGRNMEKGSDEMLNNMKSVGVDMAKEAFNSGLEAGKNLLKSIREAIKSKINLSEAINTEMPSFTATTGFLGENLTAKQPAFNPSQPSAIQTDSAGNKQSAKDGTSIPMEISAVQQFVDQGLALSENFKAGWLGVFDSMAQGFGDAMASMIVNGESFKDVMTGLWKSLASQIISMIGQMLVKWLIAQAVQAAAGKTKAASQITTAGGVAFANGVASWSGAPWPLNIGAPAFGAAMQATALTGLASVALKDGGITTGPTNALIGEAGQEAVIPLDKLEGMTGAKEQTIIMELDGSIIARSVIKNAPKEIRLRSGVIM